jgi:2-phospho-L-lactate transferase/gluconeogenesis factor (CofD/UPF0052 family)
MTQWGETQGYSVGDHIRAIDRACGQPLFDAVLVHKKSPSAKSLARYAQENSNPVPIDRDLIAQLGRRLVLANVLEEDDRTGVVRHNAAALARVLVRWYGRVQGL